MSGIDLRPDERAPNLFLAGEVEIDPSASIGANVVIEGDTVISAGARIEHGAIIGRLPALGAASSASAEVSQPTVVETGATICPGAVVFAGARIGERAIAGDQSQIRERAVLGAGSVLGRGSALGPDARVGGRVRVQTMVWLTGGTIVEDDVFIGPGVMTMNDDQMGRRPRREALSPPRFGRACRIGGGVLVTPGTQIGEEAFVASGAVLTADVPARARIKGVPGRQYGEVTDAELLENWR